MQANDTLASTALQEYLSRMEAALVRLSESDRREIILETQSHVADQAERSPMLSVPEILAELGEAEDYARTFVVESEPPARATRISALHAIARLATGSWTKLPLLFFVLCCYSVAVFMLFTAFLEIQEPTTTGFWIEHTPAGRDVSLTLSGPLTPDRGPDILGWWIIPLAVSIAAGIHLAMSALLRRVLRGEDRSRESFGSRSLGQGS